MSGIKTKFSVMIAGLLSVVVCLASLGGTTYALFSQNDDANTQTITIGESTETAAFELVFEHTDTYLYRLGNDDSVKLGSLFKDAYDSLTSDSDTASASEDSETKTAPTAPVDDASVSVTVTQHTTANGYTTDDCDSSLAATLSYNTATWENGTIAFNDYTGVVSITIKADNAAACTLYVEVIDGVNIESSDSLSLSYSKNVILLADTSLSSDSEGDYYLTLSKCTLYGNGFTVDATNGITSSEQYGIVRLSTANLDNVAIDGPEYTSSNAGLYTSSSYNTAAVRTSGDCTITNSYIEGGSCALKVESDDASVTVSDSVFAGGCWANIEVKYGELIIEGTVTTVNEPNSSVNTVGLGIVVGSPANLDDDACVTIASDATLNQYNWLYYSQDSSYFTMSGVSTIVNTANGISSIKSENYVNMGILFLNGNVDGSSGMPSDYTQASASMSVLGTTYNGYIWTPTSIPDDGLTYRSSAYSWSPSADTPYEPTYTWSYPTDYDPDNYDAVYAEIDSGDSYTLSNVSSILSAKKHGNTLDISVSVESPDDVTAVSYDSSTNSIYFSERGTYTVVFTVTDPCVYDEKGVRTSESCSLVQEMDVIINVKDSSIKTAEFSFTDGNNETYSSTTKAIDGVTYVMPDVSSTSDNIGQTSDGVYYVIVDGLGYKSGTSIWRYVPLFAGVTIKDYTDADGSYVTYDSSYSPDDTSTTDDPAVSGLEWYSIDGSMTYGWNGYTMYDSYYCRATVELASSAWNNEITVVVTYRFTATNGDVYYYCIGYYFDEEETSGCFPTGTLITLADGSQVAVEELTGDEELLVFDHETGEYTASDILFIEDYGYDSYDVVTLSFSEGYETKLIYEHAYFDLTLNKYVYINDDTLYDYIGDKFVMGDGEDIYTVTLEAVTVSAEETNCYSLVTAYQLNYFTDGFLSIPSGIEGLFNIFEYGEGLEYDEELMAADIETYGLLEYEALSDYVTEEVFDVFNGKYLAVSMGKGLITLEDIEYLAKRYGIYFEDGQ